MALPSTTYDTATLVNPGSSLTDFTLIVDLSRMSAAWWAAVDTSDGTKGRAAKDSGPTELACDWIDFDDSAETGLLRVKWSGTLATSGTQTLRIYPPVAANASVSASDTYGSDNAYDSDWAGYWPLHDEFDRTANGYDLTANGGVTVGGATGKLGAATDFDGSNDNLKNTTAAPVPMDSAYTMMAWVEPDANSPVRIIMQQYEVGGADYNQMALSFTYFRHRDYDGSTTAESINLSSTVSVNTWTFTAFERASATSRRAWYNKNRAAANTTNVSPVDVDAIVIGEAGTGGNAFDGAINHAQIHSVDRPVAWIEYEHDQVDDQATFWGTWTNTPVAGGISIPVVMHHRRMMGVS
jgi:hypothetical protein